MFFSWTFIILLFGYGIIPVFFRPGREFAIGLAVLILSWVIDLVLTNKEPLISATRTVSSPAYQHQTQPVELELINPLRRPLRVYFKDEPPFAASPGKHQGRLTIPGRGRVKFKYEITFSHRGDYEFGNLNIRYPGLLFMYIRQYQVKMSRIIKVYPDLTKIGEYNFTAKTFSANEGIHRARPFNISGELAQLREYVPGDDLRKINWKASSHVGKPIVNEYEPEKDQNVYLLFDTGRLLFDQANRERSRFDFILDSAILLAYNIIEHGDLIGALSFNQQVIHFLPPGKGERQLHSLISNFYNMEAVMVESDYRSAFRLWLQHRNKRSLLFIYTDLVDAESSKELINYLKMIAQHHLVVCVIMKKQYLSDLIEGESTDETGLYLKGVALEFQAERRRLQNLLIAIGVKVLEVSSQNISRNVVEHYLYLKNAGLF